MEVIIGRYTERYELETNSHQREKVFSGKVIFLNLGAGVILVEGDRHPLSDYVMKTPRYFICLSNLLSYVVIDICLSKTSYLYSKTLKSQILLHYFTVQF